MCRESWFYQERWQWKWNSTGSSSQQRRNTMRLIDADNAIHALGVFSDMEHGNKHFLNGINSAKEIINECVTIDAVPVVRGKWIPNQHWEYRNGNTTMSGDTGLGCSACGAV